MPTTRPRHMVTETDQVAAALDEAAERWPEDSPGRLLVRLIEEGHRALREHRERLRRDREDAIAQTSGALTGAYEADYLQRLREDWPA